MEQSSLPISASEAIALRQELENLIGRFESALLAADTLAMNAAHIETANPRLNLQAIAPKGLQTDPDNRPVVLNAPSANGFTSADRFTNETLQKAQEDLAQFLRLVHQRKYAAARQQWLATRQLLWDHFPTDRPLAPSEIRAMWLDRGTIVQAGSQQQLAKIFDRLAAAGINTVFLETVNAGYPIYPSQVAPQQNPLIRQWDPLQDAVALAHERGMELHAWVWVFAVGNQPHNLLVNLPSDHLGPILSAHPDWANCDHRGQIIPAGQDKPFLDPANPAVRQYLLHLFEEIVSRYGVDGLQLDYIRYPFQDPSAGRSYGYGSASRQQFQALTGVDPLSLSPQNARQQALWQQWTAFRVNQIDSFVSETSQWVRRLQPDLVLSTAVFAMPAQQRVQQIQQDWETWARQGEVDLIVLMSYALDTNRLQQLTTPWLSDRANLGSTLVLPGIRLLNVPNAAVIDQIQALRDATASGYALFAVQNLRKSLQEIFSRTQGRPADSPQAIAPIPYRQPFAAAASRYQSLLQEWNFLLSRGQLSLQAADWQTWQMQAQSLEQALERLSQQPSAQNLEQARAQLTGFRTQFQGWMRLQALSQSYRVQTWDNRLALLEKLLDYGDCRTQAPQHAPSTSL
ncbi:MAG TPA: family 10 glycosylhydrolase [Coleofasciculaceae cyanobacterium]